VDPWRVKLQWRGTPGAAGDQRPAR
jgi:hypothetical protein